MKNILIVSAGFLVAAGVVALAIAGCVSTPYSPTIAPGDFVGEIDNPFMPLMPGTRLVYEGISDEGRERNEVIVTSEIRVVMGVRCVVVKDTVWLNGEIIEQTYDWYAQDRFGNVWYFGEDSEEYRNGTVVSTYGSWEGGVDGAQPGIIMKANPKVGESYRQEYYPGEAEDMAQIAGLGEKATVPYGTFSGCLKILEWTPLEPGVAEYKYYAPGVGVILETVRGSRERMELVEITRG
jgi:hypothetical protein